MIEIDLLPSELRKRKKLNIDFEQFLKAKLFFAILGSLVSIHLILHMVNVVNKVRINKLGKSWAGLSTKKEKVDQLQAELTRINRKVPLIEQLISKSNLWSKKLNLISDLMIRGVWLNELSLQKKEAKKKGQSRQCLIIRGSAASRAKDELALIGRFMQNLKNDPTFSDEFSEIELGPIQKRLIGQTEVSDFILMGWFK